MTRLYFAKFALVGGLGVLVNSAALFVLYEVVGLPLVAASPLAVELAIASNFVWNDRWTFHAAGGVLARFLQFNLVALVGVGVTTATAWVLVEYVGLNYLAANLAGIGLATAWNFTTNLRWTWRTVASAR